MINNKALLAAGAIIICGITAIWFSTKTHGNPTTYELQPWISMPQYKTDAVRAIDAYERLMERYMDMTEKSSIRTNRDLKEVIKKLDSLDVKLTKLSHRIARIEKTFGIEETNLLENTESQSKSSDNQAPKEYLPIW
jgi:hypothetical protein